MKASACIFNVWSVWISSSRSFPSADAAAALWNWLHKPAVTTDTSHKSARDSLCWEYHTASTVYSTHTSVLELNTIQQHNQSINQSSAVCLIIRLIALNQCCSCDRVTDDYSFILFNENLLDLDSTVHLHRNVCVCERESACVRISMLHS